MNSGGPLTKWLVRNRSLATAPVEPSESGQDNVDQTLHEGESSDKTPVDGSVKVGNEDQQVMTISVPRKRKTAAEAVKTDPAGVKFSALVASSAKKKKEDNAPEEQPSSLGFDPKTFTTRCFELGQSIALVQLNSFQESTSPGKLRMSVELGFGADMLLYLVFESDGNRNLYEADLVKYFVNDEESIAEIAPSLEKLFKEQMYQSLVNGIVWYSHLKEQRRELLERLRVKYSPLLHVDTTERGFCSVVARDSHRTYFEAQWKVLYRRRLDVFDHAFMFSGNFQDTSLVESLNEFSFLTNDEEIDMEELEESWEKIMSEVKEVSERLS